MKDVYCELIIHKILYALSNPELISEYVDIISTIFTGVIAIIGIRYIKPLKDKTLSATFTFWSQLKIRLISIKTRLEADKEILANIYYNDTENLLPQKERIVELKREIQNTLDFIKNTPDQMPAYRGWSKDYMELIALFEDCIVYDICEGNAHFKRLTEGSDKMDYQKEMSCIIEKIITEIDNRQKKVEKKIVK